MNGFRAVAQGFLGESLRHPGDSGALCPRVSIRVKGDALDAESADPAVEFLGPMFFVHRREPREQGAFARQPVQDGGDVVAEMQVADGFRFESAVADDPVLPVHALGGQRGHVGLGAADVPEQFVEGARLGVRFPGDDAVVFLAGDGALFPEAHSGPPLLRQDGPREPVHVDGEVLDAAEVDVGRNTPVLQGAEEVFGAGFQHDEVADGVEGGFLDGRGPAFAGRTGFLLQHLVHNALPGAVGGGGVAGPPIDTGELEAEGGGLFAFVAGGDEPVGFGFVAGAEGFLFSGGEVLAVKSAPSPAEDAVTLAHGSVHAG